VPRRSKHPLSTDHIRPKPYVQIRFEMNENLKNLIEFTFKIWHERIEMQTSLFKFWAITKLLLNFREKF
jgi:hypothetical protein